MLKKGKESLSQKLFSDFLDKMQIPVFLKSLCDRLNAISINEFLSDTKELVDALSDFFTLNDHAFYALGSFNFFERINRFTI
ncbi:hypothetical protein [Succinivibrio dextrinosolvens]|uniref:hypothetical protein n=1 Tax=Succinivibrio dextrinosolvens TaxID=83771 RepID=UPI0004E1BAB7|nr:hypothetical protein [Succinivibrio dextrinosolvens]